MTLRAEQDIVRIFNFNHYNVDEVFSRHRQFEIQDLSFKTTRMKSDLFPIRSFQKVKLTIPPQADWLDYIPWMSRKRVVDYKLCPLAGRLANGGRRARALSVEPPQVERAIHPGSLVAPGRVGTAAADRVG